MAESNADLVRRALANFNAEGLDSILDLFADDFESVVPPSLSAEPDVYRGPDGARRWVEGWEGLMDEVRFEIDELREPTPGLVVAAVRLVARGRESGIEVEQPVAQVLHLGDGQLHRIEVYPTMEEALASASAT